MTAARHVRLMAALASLTGIVVLVALGAGRDGVTPQRVLQIFVAALTGERTGATDETVVLVVRLPRVSTGLCVGAGLALSGACYQGVFRNPLVSPFVLGVSGGAGLGAAVAILFLDQVPGAVPVLAFAGGLLALGLCRLLVTGLEQGSPGTLALILAGIVVSGLFGALLSLMKYMADPDNKLPLIEYWLMGSLSRARMAQLAPLAGLLVPAAAVLIALRWRLTVLTLGDDEARTMGIEAPRLRLLILALATLIASACVAVAGVVGWVGLVVPHLARMLVGPDFRALLPVSILLGAGYLVAVDTVARSVSSAEIPLGVLTALIGAPVFAALIRRGAAGWG